MHVLASVDSEAFLRHAINGLCSTSMNELLTYVSDIARLCTFWKYNIRPDTNPINSDQSTMAEVRKRTTVAGDSKGTEPTTPSSKASSGSGRFGLTDALRILGGLLFLNCAISYFVTNESVTWGWRPWYSKPEAVRAYFVSPQPLPNQLGREAHTLTK